MNITVIGTGYVGLVTACALANVGHRVVCVGRNKAKIGQINRGIPPFYEPDLPELLRRVTKKGLLHASSDFTGSVRQSEVVLIAVGTPTTSGKIDLTAMKEAAKQIGLAIKNDPAYKVIIVKSTVLPMVTETVVGPTIAAYSGKKPGQFGLCMNPEFLREGAAVSDATHPDRIVIGHQDARSGQVAAALYKRFLCPKILTNVRSAEMTKYAANSLFATMISYANEIARICEEVGGIDAMEVWEGVHLDSRLSPIVGAARVRPGMLNYILSGCGYGGSCFPKDVQALVNFAKTKKVKPRVLQSGIEVNNGQPERVIKLLTRSIGSLKGKKIAVLGLTFKPNTDDLRESPSLAVIRLLQKEQAIVVGHDPQAYKRGIRPELAALRMTLTTTSAEALKGSVAAVFLTAWDEYLKISPLVLKKSMKNPLLIDGRRMFSKEKFLKAGVAYQGIGYSAT